RPRGRGHGTAAVLRVALLALSIVSVRRLPTGRAPRALSLSSPRGYVGVSSAAELAVSHSLLERRERQLSSAARWRSRNRCWNGEGACCPCRLTIESGILPVGT